MKITIKAYAKLNLLLDITGIMPNGYHYLDNVTQSVDCYDIVTIDAEKANDFSFDITCNNPQIPIDETNIVCKAAKNFCEKAGFKIKAVINIEKNVPLMGGMGGSSVDGAAVLVGLNIIFNKILTENELLETAEKTGADVPICIKGGTLYTKTSPSENKTVLIDTDDECTFLCIQPDFSCSTAKAYALYDTQPVSQYKETDKFILTLENQGILSACGNMYNIFTVLYNDSRITDIQKALVDFGAVSAELTGSGSVIFGVFKNDKEAKTAAKRLKNSFSNTIFICHSVKKGYEVLTK